MFALSIDRCCRLRIVSATLVLLFSSSAVADEGIDFFENKIRPVLVSQCYQCHSQQAESSGKLKGGLLLDSREGIRRGGESGAAVVPGNKKESLLWSALRHEEFEMPPKGKLSDEIIADFSKWIEMGAPDPREGEIAKAETINLEAGREFWSFQPVKKSKVPPGQSAIDSFVDVLRKQQGLKPVAEAKPEHLIRRLYFDLLGLPPNLEALTHWLPQLETTNEKERELAIQALVDSLLASPHFGERWGRHWLDVARYAESNGNSRNATFPHAWRYRDYVIDSFNADTPYDVFLREQIAGDLLAADSVEQQNRQLVATGFLALGSKPVIRGKSGGFIPDIVADQIEVTSRSALGLTVACARCHDHKFDPIPTADYYALAGIFASSETLYGGGGNAMGGAPVTELHILASKDSGDLEAYRQWQKQLSEVTKRQKQIGNELKKLGPRKQKTKKAKKAARQTPEIAEKLAKLRAEQKDLGQQEKELQAQRVEAPNSAMGIREASKVTEVPIYIRGEEAKGTPIPRHLLSVVSSAEHAPFPNDQSGRLELAHWLTDKDNPLTSRVMVNRIWLHLFGEGLVRTPDNFGFNGERPTHPELLDYLAATFVEDNWSVKRMIRRIVLTRTYRLGDSYHESAYAADPDNVYLWRHSRRRLEAEAIRDAVLVTSGSLATERPAGSVVTAHGGKLIQDALTPDKIHQPSNHRSVYLPVLRNGLPESLEVFDFADPSLVVGRRSITIVPAQDLFMMNSPFIIEKSRQFARHLLDTSDDPAQRIDLAFRLAFARLPSELERERSLQFLQNTTDDMPGENPELESWASLCQALFVTAEFRHTR